jgi:hypothetical protein
VDASNTFTSPDFPKLPLAEARRFPSGLNATLPTTLARIIQEFGNL